MKKLGIFGSTGSIGQSTLAILQEQGDVTVEVLTAQNNVDLLARQAKDFNARYVVIGDATKHDVLKAALAGTPTEVLAGEEGLQEVSSLDLDWAMMAVVGAASLPLMDKLLEASKTIAVANKECIVCAGPLLLAKAKANNVAILPVDSEHNAIFQVFDAAQKNAIEKITLTASGGPFLKIPLDQLSDVTPDQALNHPVWKMGAKISVDSATMMNKGLEIIEAAYLFDLPHTQIEVLVHPQSIIHGMIAYKDGSVLAQLGMPDMRIPISYTLNYPQRHNFKAPVLDLAAAADLTFEAPDLGRFSAIPLARQCLEAGASAPVIFNAANEIAVEAFLKEQIRFVDILPIIEKTLSQSTIRDITFMGEIVEIDQAARAQATTLISAIEAKAA